MTRWMMILLTVLLSGSYASASESFFTIGDGVIHENGASGMVKKVFPNGRLLVRTARGDVTWNGLSVGKTNGCNQASCVGNTIETEQGQLLVIAVFLENKVLASRDGIPRVVFLEDPTIEPTVMAGPSAGPSKADGPSKSIGPSKQEDEVYVPSSSAAK